MRGARASGLEVLGSAHHANEKRIPRQTRALRDGDEVLFGGRAFHILEIPGPRPRSAPRCAELERRAYCSAAPEGAMSPTGGVDNGRIGVVGSLAIALTAGAVGCERPPPRVTPRPDASRADAGAATGPAWDDEWLARSELCNNGIDDDLNGTIDDGCVCVVGAEADCYPGWPATAGVGRCAFGRQRCVAAGSAGAWTECIGAQMPALNDSCNGLDDDCDHAVDEDCSCDLGATQPCFAGPNETRGVGACSDGAQVCVLGDAIDGPAGPSWGACSGSTGPTLESCNAIDDDCNGLVDDITEICDLVDDDCDGVVDEGGACAVFPESRAYTRFWPPTGSGVLPAATALHTMRAVAPHECLAGEVLYEATPGSDICVSEPPTDCPDRTQVMYGDVGWECVPCDLLVQFGGIYWFERTCAEEPRASCPATQVPTFDENSREWVCAPTCNDGLYDRAFSNGVLVCVPC